MALHKHVRYYQAATFTFAGRRRSAAVRAAFTVGNPLTSHQTRTTLNLFQQNFQQLVACQSLPNDWQLLGHVLAVNQSYNVTNGIDSQ